MIPDFLNYLRVLKKAYMFSLSWSLNGFCLLGADGLVKLTVDGELIVAV